MAGHPWLHAQAVLASELAGTANTHNPGQRRSVAVRPSFLFLSDDNVRVASLGSATDGQTQTDADASREEAEPAGRFGGLREETSLQACLRDCLFPKTEDRPRSLPPLFHRHCGGNHFFH